MKLSMFRTWVNNKWNKYIPTHIIVWCSWDVSYINPYNIIVWATLNPDANLNWIHIEVVWDFNLSGSYPQQTQYDSVKKLIVEITKQYPWIIVKKHWDFQPKNCPWVNFDMNKLKENKIVNNWTFWLSRYYSPIKWQKRYYNNKTYEQDTTMNCGSNAINNNGCLYPASGRELQNDMRWKVVACPPQYPLWTKIQLEWIWIVECIDRWWAIQWNRIDMWCWIWDNALDNWDSCPTWKRNWYLLDK